MKALLLLLLFPFAALAQPTIPAKQVGGASGAKRFLSSTSEGRGQWVSTPFDSLHIEGSNVYWFADGVGHFAGSISNYFNSDLRALSARAHSMAGHALNVDSIGDFVYSFQNEFGPLQFRSLYNTGLLEMIVPDASTAGGRRVTVGVSAEETKAFMSYIGSGGSDYSGTISVNSGIQMNTSSVGLPYAYQTLGSEIDFGVGNPSTLYQTKMVMNADSVEFSSGTSNPFTKFGVKKLQGKNRAGFKAMLYDPATGQFYPSSTGWIDRFGAEDNLAAENRSFNANGHSLQITAATTFGVNRTSTGTGIANFAMNAGSTSFDIINAANNQFATFDLTPQFASLFSGRSSGSSTLFRLEHGYARLNASDSINIIGGLSYAANTTNMRALFRDNNTGRLYTGDAGTGSGSGSSTLAGLTDVELTSPVISDVLVNDGSKWVNIPSTALTQTPTLSQVLSAGNSAANSLILTGANTLSTPQINLTKNGSSVTILPSGSGSGYLAYMPERTALATIAVTDATSSLADAATITWDVQGGVNRKVTLGGNRTLAISNAYSGLYATIVITQDGVGSRTLTLPAGSKVSGGGNGAVTLTAAPGGVDILSFYFDGTTYYWNLAKNYN